ncbi:hypothetical protein QGN23_07350 [Chryseobacterium gotjawalense]|uniref:Uncharacterized protein n=1 Tax=Chryseobacterium gotjawalense TaxID=3042315 RepID=A0ABY8RI94_9FLAO|nr:hypothetical protein [Chryseobacterium sp. wdc7]WHF53078.1 hypothetical protein QGN23_07350 [Chryseobacterium sp. wdc7]
MKKINFLRKTGFLLFFFFFSHFALAQAIGDFRTKATADQDDDTIWQLCNGSKGSDVNVII